MCGPFAMFRDIFEGYVGAKLARPVAHDSGRGHRVYLCGEDQDVRCDDGSTRVCEGGSTHNHVD